jgi:dihydropteroate synthase
MRLQLRGRVVEMPRAVVMGIVNLSPDSFSGDGVEGVEAGIERAVSQIRDGADWIDVGAESARTNRGPIPEAEEAERLLEFVRRWPSIGADRVLSINTWRSGVAERVLSEGGDVLNDIGGLPDARNARYCARNGVALVLMHTVGEPKVRHTHVVHEDVWWELRGFFEQRIALALDAGMGLDGLIVDPGIDFAKQREDNLRIYGGLEQLVAMGRPVLAPVSRKTVIGEVLGIEGAEARDAGTVACVVRSFCAGARIFRVHNVKATVETVRTLEALESHASVPSV